MTNAVSSVVVSATPTTSTSAASASCERSSYASDCSAHPMTTMPAMSLPTLGDGLAAEVAGVELALLARAVLTRSGRKTDEPDLVGEGARVGHRESIVGLERERHRDHRLLAAGEALLVDGRLRAPDRYDPDVPHQHTHLLGQTWDIGED